MNNQFDENKEKNLQQEGEQNTPEAVKDETVSETPAEQAPVSGEQAQSTGSEYVA